MSERRSGTPRRRRRDTDRRVTKAAAVFGFAPAHGESIEQMLVRWDAQVAWLREHWE